MRLHFGRLMFVSAIGYLVAAGAVGELQLMHVQALERQTLSQLHTVETHSAALRSELSALHSPSGEAQAVRSVLHYAPSGVLPLQLVVTH